MNEQEKYVKCLLWLTVLHEIYTVLQGNNFAIFIIFLCIQPSVQKRVYFEFMGGENKHLYNIVGSHMLSCEPGVSL